jgi:predicted RecB family nuclease
MHAATSCPVMTQNQFNASLPAPRNPSRLTQEQTQRAQNHRTAVFDSLIAFHGTTVRDLRGLVDQEVRVAATLQAMADGVPIILDAELPPDYVYHRHGVADVLLRSKDGPNYHPGLIRDYSLLAPSTEGEPTQLTGCLSQPFLHQAKKSHYRYRMPTQTADLLQLAHLWSLLAATDYVDDEVWGANIELDGDHDCCGSAVVWTNLKDKQLRAYSHTLEHQWKKFSPLNRYQHEHRFRVRVASHALEHVETGEPLVAAPVRIPQCNNCVWWPVCRSSLVDDISMKIERSPLDPREIMSLRRLGVTTIDDLAEVDVDLLLEEYLPLVGHRNGADERLRLAAHRGRLLVKGMALERLTTGQIALPSAPVEIDVDIETSASNHAYLWGFLVHDRRNDESEPFYHPVARWVEMTQKHEMRLAEEAARWLRNYINSLGDVPVLIWHYSNYEITSIRRFARLQNTEKPTALNWLSRRIPDYFVDLLPVVRENFFGVDGLGLKVVASEGAGFRWRDPDPSGLASQAWSHDAIHAPSPEQRQGAKIRILEYNEDDVRATAALRHWLRSLA